MNRQIILDTETTGLDPKSGHRVIEIGCVEIINRRFTGEEFHVYLNPGRDSDEGALRVHGLTTEFLKDKPYFQEVYEDFIAFGSENAVKEAGKLSVEGKEYIVQDGDVMHFRFNV